MFPADSEWKYGCVLHVHREERLISGHEKIVIKPNLRFNAQINSDFEFLSWFLCLTKLTLKIDYLSNVCSRKLFWGLLKIEICFLMKLNMVSSHPENWFCICRNLSSGVLQTVIYAMLRNFFFPHRVAKIGTYYY